MKYLILFNFIIFLFYSGTSFSNDQGIVTRFNQMSTANKDKKIEKNFNQLHKMMTELESIVEKIEKTKKQINKIKKTLETKNDI